MTAPHGWHSIVLIVSTDVRRWHIYYQPEHLAVKSMNLGESIRTGTKWLVFGGTAGRVAQFVFGIALARLLVPADFGMLVTMSVFTGLAGFFAGGGMGQALVQAKMVEDRHFHVVFTVQLSICIGIYCFFYTISPWFAVWYDAPIYKDLLRVSALTFLLRPFANIQSARLHREMRFKAKSVVALSSAIAGSTASVIMAVVNMGVWSLIFGGLIGALVNNILLQFVGRQSTRLALDKQIIRSLGAYGVKVQGNNIVTYVKSQFTNFVLSINTSPAALGLYNKADSLTQMPRQVVQGAVFQTVFRALAATKEDLDKSRYIYYRTITLSYVYVLPFFVGLWWLADPLINVIYGSKWNDAVEPARILSITGLLLLGNPSGAVLAAQNRLGRELWLQIETFPILIVAVFVGLKWGLSGVAWALVLNHVYGNARMARLALQSLGGSARQLISAMVPGYMLNAVLFGVLYFFSTYVFDGIREENDALYCVVMIGIGVLTYVLLFLWVPIPSLSSEAARWRTWLSLKWQKNGRSAGKYTH